MYDIVVKGAEWKKPDDSGYLVKRLEKASSMCLAIWDGSDIEPSEVIECRAEDAKENIDYVIGKITSEEV